MVAFVFVVSIIIIQHTCRMPTLVWYHPIQGCPVLFHMKFWNSSWLPMFEYRERTWTLGEIKRNGLKHHEDGAAGKNESHCSGEREEFSSKLELETYITTYYNCVRFSNSTTFAWSRSRPFHSPYISRAKFERFQTVCVVECVLNEEPRRKDILKDCPLLDIFNKKCGSWLTRDLIDKIDRSEKAVIVH